MDENQLIHDALNRFLDLGCSYEEACDYTYYLMEGSTVTITTGDIYEESDTNIFMNRLDNINPEDN